MIRAFVRRAPLDPQSRIFQQVHGIHAADETDASQIQNDGGDVPAMIAAFPVEFGIRGIADVKVVEGHFEGWVLGWASEE